MYEIFVNLPCIHLSIPYTNVGAKGVRFTKVSLYTILQWNNPFFPIYHENNSNMFLKILFHSKM